MPAFHALPTVLGRRLPGFPSIIHKEEAAADRQFVDADAGNAAKWE
jgi:hypothetical protein